MEAKREVFLSLQGKPWTADVENGIYEAFFLKAILQGRTIRSLIGVDFYGIPIPGRDLTSGWRGDIVPSLWEEIQLGDPDLILDEGL